MVRIANNDKGKQYDLAVIGAGLAGMATAVFAARRGLSTAILGSMGESWFTSGLIDVMGVHPVKTGQIETGQKWIDPWAAVAAVVDDTPGHPYGHLSLDDIKTAVITFYDTLESAGLRYRWHDDRNSELITAFGSIKTTHGVPNTMWAGVEALSRKAPCLIAGFEGLKGFSARLICERLKTVWPDLRPIRLPSIYGGSGQELNPLPLAQDLENEEHRQTVAGLIRPHIADVAYVGIPAVAGLHGSESVVEHLSRLIGRPVFEIPTMPPSVPGNRLQQVLTRYLANKQVGCYFQKKALNIARRPDGAFAIEVGKTVSEAQISARSVVLATGRFMGGGLQADQNRITEPLLQLPVRQPESREKWHRPKFFAAGGHALNRAGIETDGNLRPLDSTGRPVYDNLFAAGTILAHQDWVRMKCGTGLSVATGYAAVKGLAACSIEHS